jgi:nucleotide-binding universal stress UspA family protein
MYKRVLVPLDGSELAEVALPYAEELAGRLGSQITLIHVYESAEAEYQQMHQAYVEKMVEATKRGAERFLAKSKVKRVRIKSALLVGNPAEQIVDYADEENAGLIIIATHGRSGISRWVVGSVADKVVRATKRPVALIRAEGIRRDPSEKGTMDKVLVPLDGSTESEAVIPHVEELASKLDGEVVLLHVAAPAYPVYVMPAEPVPMPFSEEDMELVRSKAQGYLEKVGSKLIGKGIKTQSEVVFGSAADEIIKLAEEIGADLVAMSTHGRSGISRWAFGSTADRILQAGSTPVLLVRASSGSTD